MALVNGAGKNSVLIVDDEMENVNLLAEILRDEYIVYSENNGVDAIKTAKEKQPDVILLDVKMPGVSGLEVISALRGYNETKEIPVIILLEADMLEDEDDGEDFLSDAVDYIQKPLPPVIVKSRLRNHMRIVNQKRILDQLDGLDKLTEVFSQSFMQVRMEQEWRRAMRDGSSLSLLFLGVDDFSIHKEQHGSECCEEILKHVAHLIKSNLRRPMDVATRWDGDVFAVLFPNTPAYGAAVVAETIRVNIEKTPFLNEKDGGQIYITVTINVSSAKPKKESSLQDFVSRAIDDFIMNREDRKNSIHTISN